MRRLYKTGLGLVTAITIIGGVIGILGNQSSFATVPGNNAGIDVSTTGGNPNGTALTSATTTDISQDGRFIVFRSNATNLTSSGYGGILVRDRLNDTTEEISISTDGTQHGNGQDPRISEDGRYVVFASASTNLVSGDTNGYMDVFLRDRTLGTTTLVSITSTGTRANGVNYEPDVSADGRYIVWVSEATNLGPTTLSSGRTVIYEKDMLTGAISVISSGPSNSTPTISCEGRFIAFRSNGNLAAGTNNPNNLIWLTYIYDALAPSGQQYKFIHNESVTDDSNRPQISCNGDYVAFDTIDSGAYGTNAHRQVLLYDRINGTITKVSVNNAGTLASSDAYDESVSNDGKYVTFNTVANLADDDTDSGEDVYLRNVQAGTTELISRNADDTAGGGAEPSISSDGKYVSYVGGNLISGYTGYIYASRTGADGYDY